LDTHKKYKNIYRKNSLMIKIKLYESEIHRNETTFRPFLLAQNYFKEIGIEFTNSGDYDYAWIGQASIIDKKKPLKESIENGLEFVSKISGDYMIVDGQDSTSLIGTVDVFRESNALLFLKNSYLKDFDLYKRGWANGRMYWGAGDYSVPDIDELKPKMKLTGCNWLNTVTPTWFDYNIKDKKYDISCMFGYPTESPVYEHNLCQTDYYDLHRKNLFDALKGTSYNIVMLKDGKRISREKYYENMYRSKIIMAPIGYGEMAPRDAESAMFGSILVKDDLSYLQTKPNVFINDETYISVNYNWSDLIEKIDYILSNYGELQSTMVENMRKAIVNAHDHEQLALHLYEVFNSLKNVEVV
tara:strand:+ start:402 stop:1472 length:1071 start_codon:yes stop_codon:yes gene_type:complete